MTNFTTKGNFDEVTAQLKKKLDADDAQFNAQLNAIFKPPPAAKAAGKSEHAKPQAAKPAAPQASKTQASKKEWSSLTRRPDGSGGGGGSMRSRLRG